MANENIILERADGVAVFIITSLSLALLVYEHLTIGLFDYGLLSLCVIYLLAFSLSVSPFRFLTSASQRNKKDTEKR